METIAAKVRFHTFAAIGSLCSIGQIGLRPDLSCATHQGPLGAYSVEKLGNFSADIYSER